MSAERSRCSKLRGSEGPRRYCCQSSADPVVSLSFSIAVVKPLACNLGNISLVQERTRKGQRTAARYRRAPPTSDLLEGARPFPNPQGALQPISDQIGG